MVWTTKQRLSIIVSSLSLCEVALLLYIRLIHTRRQTLDQGWAQALHKQQPDYTGLRCALQGTAGWNARVHCGSMDRNPIRIAPDRVGRIPWPCTTTVTVPDCCHCLSEVVQGKAGGEAGAAVAHCGQDVPASAAQRSAQHTVKSAAWELVMPGMAGYMAFLKLADWLIRLDA